MPKELERDLGLYAVLTISVGAMVGSGIFVLPGLAAKIAGPAVILAYLLAGLLVLPAALSKAEMATAMPESGGTYLYIDRAMGPLMGTIAGIGAWFSLVFKSAFALVGLGAYLLLVVNVNPSAVALGLGALLVVVNVVGVKQTGRLQAVIVSVVLGVLFLFVADGMTYVDSTRYHAFFPEGYGAVISAAGFVFVSYAGVTKIASVAEEVENPGRNIPIGMVASIVVMMFVYTLVVFVVIGITEESALVDSLTPMAAGATQLFGGVGELVIAVVAVLALTSMANAGVLSSSRYPLALARDELAPPMFGRISERYRTPVVAIGFTGAVLLTLIAFVPVLQLAKLASAFQILVFVLVNVALVAFRESNLEWYDPEFVSPGYPWVQLVGILGGVVLLTQMGTLPLAGAAGIVVGGIVWYRLYGRARTEREGAALEAIRRESADRALERTREACEDATGLKILVPFSRRPAPNEREEYLTLVRLAADVVRRQGGQIQVVQFAEVPEQLDLTTARHERTLEWVHLEADTGELASDLGVPIEVGEIVTHDSKRAVANFVDRYDVDAVFGGWHPSRWKAELVGSDVDWFMKHADCDFVFVRNRGYQDVHRIVVVADRGPLDPFEILAADSVAVANDASVEFVATLAADATDEQIATTESYLSDLASQCHSATEQRVVTTSDRVETLVDVADGAEMVVTSTSAQHILLDVLFGTLPDRLVERLDCTVLLVHSRSSRRQTFLRAIIERLLY